MSGDSIHIKPAGNLVRAGYGFNETAVFELKDTETIQDLIQFAGGLNIESGNNFLNLVRYEDNDFKTINLNNNEFSEFKIKHLDSVYATKSN